jgi:hypothetical protein
MSISAGETAYFSKDKKTWVEAVAYEFDYAYEPFQAITSEGRFQYYKKSIDGRVFKI